MKRIFIIVCCLALVSVADEAVQSLAKKHVETMQKDNSLTNVVRLLIDNGEVCKAAGHNWVAGRVGESGNLRYMDYHPGTLFRHCSMCKTTQSQTLEWK